MAEFTDIERLKTTELELLKAFLLVCGQLKLKYYLMGGTMLGAVRHKGFIPWDDDIDLGMPRADYEVFKAEAQKMLPEYYFVQTDDSDPEYPHNFMKLRDSRTTFMESSVKKYHMNHGVYIDIFPLDYYPDDEIQQKKLDHDKRLLSLRIRTAFTVPEQNKHSALEEAGAKAISAMISLKYHTVKDALKARERLYRSVPQSHWIANYSGAWGKKEIVPVDWYGEGEQGTFEGLTVTLPKEYDKWLHQVYGDYMQLPPEEKRVTHHFSEIIDLDRPYTEYMK